jgi:hypothetical protein
MVIRHKWIDEQDAILQSLWGKVTTGVIAKQTGTSKRQVYHRAKALGLERLREVQIQDRQPKAAVATCDSNEMFLKAYSTWAKKNHIDLHPYRTKQS